MSIGKFIERKLREANKRREEERVVQQIYKTRYKATLKKERVKQAKKLSVSDAKARAKREAEFKFGGRTSEGSLMSTLVRTGQRALEADRIEEERLRKLRKKNKTHEDYLDLM